MVDIEKIKITDIVPAEYNPRLISDEELLKLRNSIDEFGLVDPIIINLKNNSIRRYLMKDNRSGLDSCSQCNFVDW